MADPIVHMRAALAPQGTSDIVVLRCQMFLHHPYITEVLDALERKTMIVASGIDEFTPLEKFAIMVLGDMANIDSKPKGI